MNVVNKTPFMFAAFPGKVHFPNDSLTLVVKATVQLRNGGPAQLDPAVVQLPLVSDQYYDDDPNAVCRYPSDFVPFKPRADVLLSGCCYQASDQSAPTCRATFQVGPM